MVPRSVVVEASTVGGYKYRSLSRSCPRKSIPGFSVMRNAGLPAERVARFTVLRLFACVAFDEFVDDFSHGSPFGDRGELELSVEARVDENGEFLSIRDRGLQDFLCAGEAWAVVASHGISHGGLS